MLPPRTRQPSGGARSGIAPAHAASSIGSLRRGRKRRMNPMHREARSSARLHLFQELPTLAQQLTHPLLLGQGLGRIKPMFPPRTSRPSQAFGGAWSGSGTAVAEIEQPNVTRALVTNSFVYCLLTLLDERMVQASTNFSAVPNASTERVPYLAFVDCRIITAVTRQESQVGEPPIMPTLFESRKPKTCRIEKQQYHNPDQIHRPQREPVVNRKKFARASH
jgi:hypothetical protein